MALGCSTLLMLQRTSNMVRYALVSPTDIVDRFSEFVEPNVQTKAGWRWLLASPTQLPSITPATEKITGPMYTVEAESVTEVWTVVPLTAQEISDQKDAAINSLNGSTYMPLLRGLLNLHNRIRVLEGSPIHTMTQFKTAIKALL